LRSSKASITESFCQFIEGELYVINMSIDEYKLGTFYNHKIKRERKLLLHKRELQKWERKLKDVGNTIIPLKLYINEKGKQSSLSLLVEGKNFLIKEKQ
jgi:SsrA-binding protein